MLTATVPASDTKLLTPEQMRVAYGLAASDSSQDTNLAALNVQISAAVVQSCRIAHANGGEPTLKQETLRQVERCPRSGPIVLARRHKVEIVSIHVDNDSNPLNPSLYEVEEEGGLLHHLDESGNRICWTGLKVTIVYKAGFPADAIPADIIAVATDVIRLRKSEAARDPLVRRQSVRVDGVDEVSQDFWVNATSAGSPSFTGGPIPAEYAARLERYMNWVAA